ncbi:MAG: hypothetical protein JNM75_03895 [Rhodospirillales bacterium]|nr:hypothetical protein [Rhodospirillales bacterium]
MPPSLILNRRTFGRLAGGGVALALNPAWAAQPSLLASVPQRRLVFDVYGLDRTIGSHEVTIDGSPDAFVVRSEVDIEVRVLGLSLYTYRHSGVETWRRDRLSAFASTTVSDERSEKVSGRATKDGFEVKGRQGVVVAPAGIMVGSFWTQRIMAQTVVLDPQKGTLEKQVVHSRERTTWPVDGKPRPVTRYQISSVLDGDIAYDDGGRWVGARFRKKNTDIEYRLRA